MTNKKLITANSSGPPSNTITVSGSIQQSDIQSNNLFGNPVVVVSFHSISNPNVNYAIPGSLAGLNTNALFNPTIRIPSNSGLPAGNYNLTVFIPGDGYHQIQVNVG